MKTSPIQPPLGTKINSSHPLSQGLVGNWLCNEGGGLKSQDSTRINSIDGTLTSGAKFQQTTRGNAIFFDGVDDFVSIPSDSFISSFNNISVSAWFNFVALPSLNNYAQIMMKNNANADYYGIVVQWDGTCQWQCKVACNTAAGTITAGKWFHIVGTRNINLASNQAVIYINGVNKGVATSTSAINTSTTALTFGKDSVNNRPANALIQDVKIYNRALSPSEIMQLYTNSYQMFIGKVR